MKVKLDKDLLEKLRVVFDGLRVRTAEVIQVDGPVDLMGGCQSHRGIVRYRYALAGKDGRVAWTPAGYRIYLPEGCVIFMYATGGGYAPKLYMVTRR